METIIPKIFHQIWLNGKLPEEHCCFRDHMLELHPGWEYKLWTKRNMPKLINQDIFDKWPEMCFKADVLRYEILYKFGGIYIDTDFLFYKNIEECMQKEYLIVNEFDEPYFHAGCYHMTNNCLIGAVPKSALMQYVVYKLRESMQRYEELKNKYNHFDAGLSTVGPYFFDKCVEEIIGRSFSYDTKYFCPFRPHDLPHKQYENFPDAYAIHLWNNNWRTYGGAEVYKTLPCYKRKHGIK